MTRRVALRSSFVLALLWSSTALAQAPVPGPGGPQPGAAPYVPGVAPTATTTATAPSLPSPPPPYVPPSLAGPAPTAPPNPAFTLTRPSLPPPSAPTPGQPPREEKAPTFDGRAKLAPAPDGITSDMVAAMAKASSTDVAVRQATLEAAAAKVDQAIVSWLPRLSGVARYTRLSKIVQPVFAGGVKFPVVLDNYVLQGTLSVPLSDYLFRLSKAYSAATMNEKAAKLDTLAGETKSAADARVSYYSWVKAIGQREVLAQSLEVTKEHLKDAQNLLKAGLASQADVLAVQAQVAGGEATLQQASGYVAVAEEQLRMATHIDPNKKLTVGEDVLGDLPKVAIDIAALRQEALAERPELKSIQLNEEALMKSASAIRAGGWPRLDATGNIYYSNPNQRIFPTTAEFRSTWDVGLQLSWSPNDVFATRANAAELEANAGKLRAQRTQIRDGLGLEVVSAAQDLRTAEANVDNVKAQLVASEEAYRVRRETYRAGKATSVELADAEVNLFRAQLAMVTASVDLRIAKVKLDHATGRDAKRR
jgi:outer membrane protein TolC